MRKRILELIFICLLIACVVKEITYNVNKRIAVINFQFDDGCKEDSRIVELFDQFNMKCGFALPSTVSEKTILNDYQEYYRRGYEILSHSTNGTPMGDNSEEMEVIRDRMNDSKQLLEKCGFEIMGWVTPSSVLHDDYKPLLKEYYEYAYTNYYGVYDKSYEKRPYNKKDDNPYELYRISLDNSYNDIKVAIDKTIEDKGFLTFYFHGRDLTVENEDKIRNVLKYLKELENKKECMILPPNAAYNYYFVGK